MSKRYLDYHGVTVLWTAIKNYIASVTPSIKKLTFTGGVTAEYDGTADITVNIPTGGQEGTSNYSDLNNKPKINNVELSGNKTNIQLGIPTKVSDLTNDIGFIETETDPTVPAWAKSSTKPTYTASEVGALPSTTHIPTTSDIQAAITVNPYTIANSTPIATINGVEISAPTAGAITITTVQSDWNVTDTTSGAYIANKPNLAAVATSGSYNDLSNKPTIPAAVSVTNTLSSGTRVATINGTDVYAPAGESGAFLFRMYVDNSDNSCYFYNDDYPTLALACESNLCALCVGDNTNGYKIFQYYSCGGTSAVNSSYKGSYTFIRNEFNGTTMTTEKIVITQGNSAEAYTGMYSLESIAFNYTSATSTLEITTN